MHIRIKPVLVAIVATATVASSSLLVPSQVAAVQSSIEGGDIYRVRNITKGTDFTDPAAADKCDELQYKVRIHNPGPDEQLTNVTVSAAFGTAATAQNTSIVTVRAANASPSNTSDTATVNLSAAHRVNYVAGSSQLLDANGGVISGIGDVTAGSGVNIGTLGISLNEKRFVQFKARVDCPVIPPVVEKEYVCTSLNATMVSRTRYDFKATASVKNVTIQNYVFTVKNQSNNTVDTRTVTTGATTADYQFNQSTPGNYTVHVVINTDAGATNPDTCKKQITVVEEGKTPPVVINTVTPAGASTSGTPSGGSGGGPLFLPEAGPADVAAIATAVTVLSSIAYYVVSRRFGSV